MMFFGCCTYRERGSYKYWLNQASHEVGHTFRSVYKRTSQLEDPDDYFFFFYDYESELSLKIKVLIEGKKKKKRQHCRMKRVKRF